jgi:outer membrane protein
MVLLIAITVSLPAQMRQWSLEECIAHALENNTGVKQQHLQTLRQQNQLTMARLSLLPSLSGTGSWNMAFGRALDQTTYEFIDNQTVISGQIYAGSNITLFNGLRTYNNIVKSRYELVAAGYDLELIKDNLTLNVTLAYLQILLSRELVSVAENQLELTRQQIKRISDMVETGGLTRGSLLDIQAQAAKEEMHLTAMRNNLDLSTLALTQLMDIESVDGFDIVTPLEVEGAKETGATNDSTTDIYSKALSYRPEILSAETRLRIAALNLRIARGGQSPKLTLSNAFSTGYSDARRRLLNDDPLNPVYGYYSPADQFADNINYGIGLSLSVPLLNGWQVRTGIKNAQLEVTERDYILEEARKQLYRDIQRAMADAVAAQKSFEAGEKALEALKEAFRYAEERLSVGLVTPAEYNTAKTNLLISESELLQAKYEFVFKTRVLDFYQGIPISLK